jgi:hypothetical protein
MKYKAVKNPYHSLKAGLDGMPKRVSFYGALPIPPEAYEVKYAPSIEMEDASGRVTYSNYFFGEVIKTFEQASDIAEKLNNKKS